MALRLHAEGRDEEGRELAAEAEAIEEEFRDDLTEFLSRHEVAELPEAPFFPRLYAQTADSLRRLTSWRTFLLASGEVTEVGDDLGRVEGVGRSGEPVAVDLRMALLRRNNIGVGDPVVVLYRMVGDSALVEVEPGVRAYQFKVESQSEGARRYAEGAASRPDMEYLAALRQRVATGQVPRRVMRPIG